MIHSASDSSPIHDIYHLSPLALLVVLVLVLAARCLIWDAGIVFLVIRLSRVAPHCSDRSVSERERDPREAESQSVSPHISSSPSINQINHITS